jgi:hypothetical protein
MIYSLRFTEYSDKQDSASLINYQGRRWFSVICEVVSMETVAIGIFVRKDRQRRSIEGGG